MCYVHTSVAVLKNHTVNETISFLQQLPAIHEVQNSSIVGASGVAEAGGILIPVASSVLFAGFGCDRRDVAADTNILQFALVALGRGFLRRTMQPVMPGLFTLQVRCRASSLHWCVKLFAQVHNFTDLMRKRKSLRVIAMNAFENAKISTSLELYSVMQWFLNWWPGLYYLILK